MIEKPADVATASTSSFVQSNVRTGGDLIEVGCGTGAVASDLLKAGYSVVGVDSDLASIEQARKLGLTVLQAEWPDVSVKPCDAVIFTRSLHHIADLDGAIEKTKQTLRPDGVIVVEDFAFDEIHAASIAWFVKTLAAPAYQNVIQRIAGELVTALLGSDDPLASWHQDHDHNLHSAAAMRSAIEKQFRIKSSSHVPYLYRYLIPVLPETREAARLVQDVYEEEAHLGKTAMIALLGRRVVASLTN